MAKDKKSFIAYADWIESFEELDDAEAGRLAKHLFRYVNDQTPEAPDKLTKMCFIPIKQALKRDLEKYESIRERNKENGKKGGRPKKPTGLSGNSEKPKKADSDNVNDSVNDIKDKPLTPKGESFDFDIYLETLNKVFNRNFKVVNKTVRSSIKARLKEGYTKKNILNAIINCKNDRFHKENNYKYCTPRYFAQVKVLDMHGDSIQNNVGSNTYQLID